MCAILFVSCFTACVRSNLDIHHVSTSPLIRVHQYPRKSSNALISFDIAPRRLLSSLVSAPHLSRTANIQRTTACVEFRAWQPMHFKKVHMNKIVIFAAPQHFFGHHFGHYKHNFQQYRTANQCFATDGQCRPRSTKGFLFLEEVKMPSSSAETCHNGF